MAFVHSLKSGHESNVEMKNSVIPLKQGKGVQRETLQQNQSKVFSESTRGHAFLVFLFSYWAGSIQKSREEKGLKVEYMFFGC